MQATPQVAHYLAFFVYKSSNGMHSNFAERSSRNYININFLYASDTVGGALPGLFCLTSASDGSPCEAADRKAESLRTVSVSEGRT